MGETVNVEISPSSAISDAKLCKDGFWRDSENKPLKISASDIERHAYCPMSWSLARQGNSGQGEAIIDGKEKHAKIHKKVTEFQEKQIQFKRHLLIWTWWFSVIIALVIDSIAFIVIDDIIVSPIDLARYLALWSVILLFATILAIYLPWRSWFGLSETLRQERTRLIKQNEIMQSEWETIDFQGGWFEAGKIEISLLFSVILLGIHSIALVAADNRTQAGFILFTLAMFWTLAASWQLQRTLLTENAAELARKDVGLNENTEVVYSDDEKSAGLLIDDEIGLRGRPDQIVVVDGEFIPVEQKTGRIPKRPHLSHKMQLLAYLHLVEVNTKRSTPYGILRYGNEDIHQIYWDDETKEELFSAIQEIQRLMVEGGAKRNHERKGKCQNCSRKYACSESLA
jgi:CRISPR/Cas system-associated exonuclease Cas4 (RecB family)